MLTGHQQAHAKQEKVFFCQCVLIRMHIYKSFYYFLLFFSRCKTSLIIFFHYKSNYLSLCMFTEMHEIYVVNFLEQQNS